MLYIELAIIIALILINGLLALAELAIVSSRRARLRALVDRDVIGARHALALSSNPGRFLSTVQIGITLVGVLSGAFSGSTIGLRLAEWFTQLGLTIVVAEAVGIGLVVAVIAYFSLVIGELVPKQIALRDPEHIAVRVAPAMTVIARIFSPIVSFLDISGRAVLRALGYRAQIEHRVTDEEIRTLIAEAETAGILEPGERAMIAGVMRLGDRPIKAVMTPRREVDMIDLGADPQDIRRTIVESIHSRLPVYAGTPDEMLGVIQAKDLLDAYLRGERPDVRAQVRSAANVPDTVDALDVLDVIKRSPVHMALVHDELILNQYCSDAQNPFAGSTQNGLLKAVPISEPSKPRSQQAVRRTTYVGDPLSCSLVCAASSLHPLHFAESIVRRCDASAQITDFVMAVWSTKNRQQSFVFRSL
jgi:putative hemolysin